MTFVKCRYQPRKAVLPIIIEKAKKLVFLCLYFLVNPVFSQQYYFKNIGVEQGLSHNTVYAIFQDKTGFMWFGTKDGLNRYDGFRFKVFKNDPDDPRSLGNNTVNALHEDQKGMIWVGTNAGIYLYQPHLESFFPFETKDQTDHPIWGQVLEIREDLQGDIWIATSSSGVYRFEQESQTLTYFYHDPEKRGSLASGPVSSMTIDDKGTVWVGILGGGVQKFIPANETFMEYMDPRQQFQKELILDLFNHGNELLIGTKNGGLKRMEKSTGKTEDILVKDHENNPLFVRNIAKYNNHEIWIGTELGIYLYNITNGSYSHVYQNDNDPYSLSDNAIYTIFQDREGGIWLGSYFAGLNYLPNHSAEFEKYYPVSNQNSIGGKRVREFVEDPQGKIWIGTEDNGLSRFDPLTKFFVNFRPDRKSNSISYHNIHGLLISDQELWVSSHSQGLKLDILDLKSNRFKKIDQSALQNPLFDSDVFSILEDRKGNKWFGTISGVYRQKKGNSNFEFVDALGINFFQDIIEDQAGYLWFASANNGLFRFEPENETVKHFFPDNNKPGSIPRTAIINLFEDSKQRLWLGTEGDGLCLFDPKTETFRVFDSASGLPSNTIYKILEDDLNYLWFSTGNGLVRFLPETESIEVYTKANGLLSDQFNYKSGLKSKNGKIYFGTLNGFVAFDPKTFSPKMSPPELRLTGVKLFNQEIPIGVKDSPLKQSITNTQALRLSHDQSSISLSFAALGYTLSESWQYAYILEGLEKDWNMIDKNQEISYLNLAPGTYTFRVKTIGSDKKLSESEARLEIEISPPFYRSPFAYMLYAVLLVLIIIRLVSLYKKRISARHRENIKLLEDEKQKEIYRAKIEFFTNITHEIRTPLTLIKGPLEVILQKKESLTENILENLLIMERNANRLISLSNQLLDFRKTEKKNYTLNFVTTDIIKLIQELHLRFKPMAAQQQIVFSLHFNQEVFLVDIDKEEVTKILSNLISNALKNAETTVSLHLVTGSTKDKDFGITVCNDGKMIDDYHKEKIFEPFYQIHSEHTGKPRQGTGLGLPLARSLAEMHNGNLYLDPDFDKDRICFTLKLPKVQKEAFLLEDISNMQDYQTGSPKEVNPESESKNESSKPMILLVEDNKELLKFMGTNLRHDYHIYKANHGKQALEILDEKPVDLIISDIMMPVMDGIMLCREVKSKLEYSHIPFVLLTAKSNLNSKIEGMEMGADVYIEKPFSLEYLTLQIKNLLNYRDTIRINFASSPNSIPATIAHTKADEVFLNQANACIISNITNEMFGVNELAELLNMSQSSLLRKFKGIAKMTPNEYIRLVRLKKAAEILNLGMHSISEVSALVGFNSPSYFSKCFQKQFGELPKDYHKTDSE